MRGGNPNRGDVVGEPGDGQASRLPGKGTGRTIITHVNIEFSVPIQQTENSCRRRIDEFHQVSAVVKLIA
jgi:hypothetical protein